MRRLLFNMRQLQRRRLFIFLAILALEIIAPRRMYAHQQPTSIVLLDVKPDRVAMELQVPLSELELAFGHDVTAEPERLVERWRPDLTDYLLAHIHPATGAQDWTVAVNEMAIGKAEQTQSGSYQEIIVRLTLLPPAGITTRQFILNYDVIMHQVVSHKALVGIRRDWAAGRTDEPPVTIGIIRVNTETTRIDPLDINLVEGGWWKAFKGMVGLGAQHIREGTDHLLFLLLLLLPAPLLARGNRWGEFGGAAYGIKRLLKIVTAFTVGHSLTLLVGALNWLRLPPPPPVEVLIAVSILVSAVHAVHPIFPGRENYVAAGFGLVHGLAFASVLSDFDLHAMPLALSIFGFNVGIELMQLFVIAITVPWLILFSPTPFYRWIRIGGATLAAAAAAAWIAERVFGKPNAVGIFVQNNSKNAHLGILVLALLALLAYGWQIGAKKFSVEIQPE